VIAYELTEVYERSRVDPDYQSFCAVSEGMNCETVALSPYATVAGSPTSVWAMAGYAFGALLCIVCLVLLDSALGRSFLALFSFAAIAASAALVYVMAVLVRSFCVLCLALDAVNVGLLVMSLLACRSAGFTLRRCIERDFSSLVRRPAFGAAVLVPAVSVLAGAYVYGRTISAAAQEAIDPEQSQVEPAGQGDGPGKWTSALDSCCDDQCGCGAQCQGDSQCSCGKKAAGETIQMGVDESGHQWVGGTDPRIVIEEFTDYECPHCRKAHLMVRKLLSKYAGRIKVIHRHYPLSNNCNRTVKSTFHERACELSAIAVCAGKQGRFWEMNDFLFQHAQEIRSQKMTAAQIAARLELDTADFECCMGETATTNAIKADIEAGISYKIKGTPAFVIDGTVYYGKVPDEAVQRLE